MQSVIGKVLLLSECYKAILDLNVFRALASYIRRYARSNANTGDLWSVLQEESDNPVNKLMDSWTKQKGYPVVSVNIKDQTLEFEQSQFLLSGSHGEGQWIVPVTLCCSSYEAYKSFLLQTKSETLDVKEIFGASNSSACPSIKVNLNQTTFFRVKYDELLSARLRNAIERKCLSVSDKYEKVPFEDFLTKVWCSLPRMPEAAKLTEKLAWTASETQLLGRIESDYDLAFNIFNSTPGIRVIKLRYSSLDLNLLCEIWHVARMSRTHFPHSQFIVISLKKSMFNNATVTVQRAVTDN
ncbi:hypothetical protein OROHE_014159 [Orobanche hederae]